jgi:two-component system chemotaxis response regulator CheY
MASPILIADDSATVRQIVQVTLTQAGWPVVVARNGREALNLAQEQQAALVITDWNMPEMGGLELLRALRDQPAYASIPILVLTTETGEDDKDAAREAGASGWIGKPVDPRILLDVVSSLLPLPHDGDHGRIQQE